MFTNIALTRLFRDGNLSGRSSGLEIDGDTLLSFGSPIVRRLTPQAKRPHEFLVNAAPPRRESGWGNASHFWEIRNVFPRSPLVAFDALYSAGIRLTDLTIGSVLNYELAGQTMIMTEDGKLDSQWLHNVGNYQKPEYATFQKPKQGMFVAYDQPHGVRRPYYVGYWHVLGGTLLAANGSRYLSGLDEASYFLAHLSAKARPRTVEAAYKSLMPAPVKRAQANGETIRRQGEWFCVDTELDDRGLADKLGFRYLKQLRQRVKQDALPRRSDWDNKHVVRQFRYRGTTYAKGMMYHRNRWDWATREHRSLRLDTWHRVYRNTEQMSWSVDGRVD